MRLQGLPPLAARKARVLILGSMPGAASLQAQQYYAHPHNLFWPFMQELLGIDRTLPYARRTRLLTARGVAVWDVIASCERRGSLDADIRDETVNDFPAFLAAHPRLEAIFLNGRKAEATFRRHALPLLGERLAGREPVALPSTSPANASVDRHRKLAAWRRIVQHLPP